MRPITMLCQEGVETFKAFCGTEPRMGMKSFAKLCRDCGLIDQALTICDVDLIFAKVVSKAQRTMGLEKFQDALRLVAEKKGTAACEVCRAVEQSGGPILRSTKAAAVRFHDDRSTYTGTQARGRAGPKGTATGQVWQSSLRPRSFSAENEDASPSSSGRDIALSADGEVCAVALWESSIEEVFKAYCGGQPCMDGKSFLKLCKDSQLHDRCLTPTDLDLIFTKVVPKGHRRINVRCFQNALWHIAEKKGVDVQAVCSHVALLGSGGPILNGTKAETVRFHDDRSTYTGTHIHGGPDVGPTIKASQASDLWLSLLRPEARCEVKRRSSDGLVSGQQESSPPCTILPPRHSIVESSPKLRSRSSSPKLRSRESSPQLSASLRHHTTRESAAQDALLHHLHTSVVSSPRHACRDVAVKGGLREDCQAALQHSTMEALSRNSQSGYAASPVLAGGELQPCHVPSLLRVSREVTMNCRSPEIFAPSTPHNGMQAFQPHVSSYISGALQTCLQVTGALQASPAMANPVWLKADSTHLIAAWQGSSL